MIVGMWSPEFCLGVEQKIVEIKVKRLRKQDPLGLCQILTTRREIGVEIEKISIDRVEMSN